MEPVHIINIDIRDNHEDATIGSFDIHALCQMVCAVFSKVFVLICTYFMLLRLYGVTGQDYLIIGSN